MQEEMEPDQFKSRFIIEFVKVVIGIGLGGFMYYVIRVAK